MNSLIIEKSRWDTTENPFRVFNIKILDHVIVVNHVEDEFEIIKNRFDELKGTHPLEFLEAYKCKRNM